MRIKKLELNNFRGFKELEINFPESNLLVLVGINGSGKSSILDCIAMFFSQFVSLLPKKRDRRDGEFEITENDINIDAEVTGNIMTMKSNLDYEISYDNTFSWRIWKSRTEKSTTIGAGRVLSVPSDYKGLLHKEIHKKPDLNLTVLVYYQNQKIFLESPEKSGPGEYESSQYYAYEGAFKKGIHDFDDFISWFKDEEDWENQQKIKEGLGFVNKNLEVIRRAIQTFLNEIPSTDFSHLHVVRTKKDKAFRFDNRYESSLVIEKDGRSLKLEQLSDGEKMLLLVVSDLARRLSIANPGLDDALQGKGVVLIDEVDLHLHPQWQREVIPALRRTFPNCQFIVTTHSPQVLSNVEKENVLILEDFKLVEKTPFTYGKDSNSILYQLMNVEERPAAIKKELDKLYRLIDAEKMKEARAELKKLEKVLGEDDKDILRANMYIHF
jgi:predicted ATP-binding protein involved in virulence